MYCGTVCGRCCGGKCIDEPTVALPISFACVACDGRGCDACGGTGQFDVTECPRRYAGGDGRNAVFAMDQANHGCWPSAGGWMDQADSVVAAVRCARSDLAMFEQQIRAGVIRPDDGD